MIGNMFTLDNINVQYHSAEDFTDLRYQMMVQMGR